MKLLLFDLDGTLVSTGGAGLRALDRAFAALFGLRGAMEGISPAGKTDPLIVREVFEKKRGTRPAAEDVRRVCESYLAFLSEEVPKSPGYRVMEGIRELLDRLWAEKGALLALGTGNLERGARIKLEPGGLNRYFNFGGFGSDAEARADMLRAGVRRAEERTGMVFPLRDVFVIGDTILDVKAGKEVGAVTVAVACGHGKRDDLRVAQPDVYMESFADPAPLWKALGF